MRKPYGKYGMMGVLVLALLLGLLLAAAPAGAATKTAGTYVSEAVGIDESQFVYWESGAAAHYRDLIWSVKLVSTDDARLTGLGVNTFSGNYAATGSGPFFGTGVQYLGTWDGYEFTPDPDGAYWFYTFHGWQPADPSQPMTSRYEGYGVGGSLAGLHLAGTEDTDQITSIGTGVFVVW